MSMKEIWITGKKGFPPKWLLALDRYYPRCAYSLGVWNTFFLRLGSGGCSVRSSADTCHSLPKEYFADPYYEGNTFLWNGVEDLAEYTVAVIMAFALGYLLSYSAGYPFHWI